MIQTLLTRRLRQLHSKMSDHYDLIESEACDYQDWPKKHNRLLQIKGDMHHIKKVIEICDSWGWNTGVSFQEVLTAAAIIILTILGLIYL